ncbi:MAG: MmgE/PrpD family protein [Betaproteobacteria bacterium]
MTNSIALPEESSSPSLQLGQFVSELRYEQLPAEVIAKAKELLADALGCAVGAMSLEPWKVQVARRLWQALSQAGDCTVVGIGSADSHTAALINGFLINATDNDDTHKRALLHAGSCLVPASLAMAQRAKRSGTQMIEALVAGYEVCTRVGMAVMPSHYRFWHSTATNGQFGAAAAVARLLELEPDQIRTALNYAATQASGLNVFFETGDDSKSIHPGKAALNGMLAAFFAQAGASSPKDSLVHPKGYLAAYSLDPKPAQLVTELGTRWEILQNGIKLYPSILASHSPIGATLDIVRSHNFTADEVINIEIDTHPTVKSHFSSKLVQSEMAARLSVPYCVAIAAVDKAVSQEQFQLARIRNLDVQRVLAVTEVHSSESLAGLYPEKFPARVRIRLRDGRSLESYHEYPKGDPSNPLSRSEFRDKFNKNTVPVMGEMKAETLWRVIMSIEDRPVADLTAILDQVRDESLIRDV